LAGYEIIEERIRRITISFYSITAAQKQTVKTEKELTVGAVVGEC
jgi:hypothetical protein